MAAHTLCPDCEGRITVPDGYRIGRKLRCPHCDADLVVSHVKPLELDWDEDDDDDDLDEVYEDDDNWDT